MKFWDSEFIKLPEIPQLKVAAPGLDAATFIKLFY